MKLNALEFALMNNPVRAASQRHIETPLVLGRSDAVAGKRVLEIGCGRGVGMDILLQHGASMVAGCDLDPRMVALARQYVGRYGDRAQVFVGDASVLAVPDSSVDAVVDYGIVHHIPEWPQVLRETARVLRPGGTFYFEDLLRGFIAAWPIRVLFDHPQATQFTANAFRTALETAGFSVRHWRELGPWAVIGQAASSDGRSGSG